MEELTSLFSTPEAFESFTKRTSNFFFLELDRDLLKGKLAGNVFVRSISSNQGSLAQVIDHIVHLFFQGAVLPTLLFLCMPFNPLIVSRKGILMSELLE